MTLTWAQADHVLGNALARAVEIGVPSCVAVVDLAGELVVYAAMDGCLPVCRRLAIGKAVTAAYLRMPTEDAGALVEPGGPFPWLENGLPRGTFVPFAGGRPLGSPVVGAVGVSGGTLDDDIDISTHVQGLFV